MAFPGPVRTIFWGEPAENAILFTAVLEGERGPLLDITVLNAAAALYVAGVCQELKHGVELARQTVESGQAAAKLAEMRDFRNSSVS